MTPQRITDVYPFNGHCAINLDYQGEEFRICWTGDWRKPPNLSTFPQVDGATSSKVPHSPEVDDLWTNSQVLGYGADSHIRKLVDCVDGFPICKVAIDDRQRLLLQEEFALFRYLSATGSSLPVVKTWPHPLKDQQGIFGFRMETLHNFTMENALEYFNEIKTAVLQLHEVGVIHYDLSLSNLMLNKEEHITLIDFGRAGYVGNRIPLNKEKGIKPTGLCMYSVSWDSQALLQMHNVMKNMTK
ncbi:hypothetical protein S7711_10782 [Stachybotrys chartarum IBT 7711]|uniref:EKC/KEOPS complex subunit BUD32 n=1 Tax=Stachybotrys chartarum (strain CBS 109288 / IBT 7711) TaxID=1280523 RepID=A0A084AHT4_STACB|nr:hypothetical protein S7711_10782 [Stachybotrys chartarum IBT 7711]